WKSCRALRNAGFREPRARSLRGQLLGALRGSPRLAARCRRASSRSAGRATERRSSSGEIPHRRGHTFHRPPSSEVSALPSLRSAGCGYGGNGEGESESLSCSETWAPHPCPRTSNRTVRHKPEQHPEELEPRAIPARRGRLQG